jgi:NitT/TauT family transport system ATP-binding protein
MARISIVDVSKSYVHRESNTVVEALKGFALEIEKGEFVVFFGPNGCGKTTILNLIAGLSLPDIGSININGNLPKDAKIGYVFQNFRESLFPWMKNIDNIAFPLEIEKIPKPERYRIVKRFLNKYGINIPQEVYPYQLSGGQQQLIAIVRALVTHPDVLLMDEPFNGLDYETRMNMYKNLILLWMETKVTTLFVSHDIEEAVLLASRLILLTKRPASIKKVFENNLPYPRTRETLWNKKFLELKAEALQLFREELT